MDRKHRGEVAVLFTTPEHTTAALGVARRLNWPSHAPLRLVVTLPVPYPLPLTSPPVSLRFVEEQARELAAAAPAAIRVDLYLCRDRREALRDHLAPGSLVVIGQRPRRWWGAPERRLARWLQHRGYLVVVTSPEQEAGPVTAQRNLLHFRMPNSSH